MLKLTGAAIAAAVLLTPVVRAEEGTRFKNPGAGITVIRPAGWHTVTIQRIEENGKNVRIPDEQLQEVIQKYASAPLFAFTKHPEPHDDMNPSIQVGFRPLGSIAGRLPTEILTAAVKFIENSFNNFTFVDEVQETTVSGMPAAYMSATYRLPTESGVTYDVLSRMWIVPRGSFMFMIGMGGPESGPEASEEEFTEFMKSIVIEK